MMATEQQILAFLQTPGLSDQQIATELNRIGATAQQVSNVTGVPVAQVQQRIGAVVESQLLNVLQQPNLTDAQIVQEIKNLKQQNGPELQVYGSSNLIQTLMKHDMIDGFRLKIFPITLGTGKRLFGDGTIPAGFKLVDSKASTTGVIVANYERAGLVKTGLIASNTPSEAELARRKRINEGN